MRERIWLLDIEALDGSDVAATLRFASAAYIDPSNNYYDLRLAQPALYTVKAFGAVVPGSARSGYGEAVLLNTDGGLDYLVNYAVDGRLATVRLVDETGTITQVLRGTVAGLTFNDTKVTVRLRDPQEALQKPHPQTVYGGTNALPAGVDGVATDIKGKNQPRVYGRVRNLSPVLVNTARLIYQAHDRAEQVISAVYDRGVALGAGADYASLADLQANVPSAGQYRRFQGYFRLGSTPTGQVTADADAPVTALGSVFNLIATEAAQTVNAGDVTALNSIGDVGVYLTDNRNTSDLLDLLANSAGGFWTFDPSGTIRAQQLLAPSSPTQTLNPYEVVKITRRSSGAGSNGLPLWRVLVNADRVETVQTDLASSVPASTVARLAQQFRQAIAETPSTLTRHPLADQITLETALRALADGQTQSTRLAALFAGRRDAVSVEARLDAETVDKIAIGTVLTLITGKLGYSAGRDFIVVGYTLDARLSRVTLDLWG